MAEQPFWDGSGGLEDIAWETAWIDGYYIPGLVSWQWTSPPTHRIEKKPVKGNDGTKVTDQGEELAAGILRTQVYTTKQWEQFQVVLPILWQKKKGGQRKPVSITYPSLNLFEINTVYIESIEVSGPVDQIVTVDFHVLEYEPNPKEVTQAAGRGDDVMDAIEQGNQIVAQNLVDQMSNDLVQSALTAKDYGNEYGEPPPWESEGEGYF